MQPIDATRVIRNRSRKRKVSSSIKGNPNTLLPCFLKVPTGEPVQLIGLGSGKYKESTIEKILIRDACHYVELTMKIKR